MWVSHETPAFLHLLLYYTNLTGSSGDPVITKGDPGSENNKYGFEGGRALRIRYMVSDNGVNWSREIFFELEEEIPDVWKTNDDGLFDGYFASIGSFRVKLIR